MAAVSWTINAGASCGPLRFGMSQADVASIKSDYGAAFFWNECVFDRDGLRAVKGAPDAPNDLELVLNGTDLLGLGPLDCALFIEGESSGARQAQGGSLYFPDLSMAILQFESPARDFMLYAEGYDHGEPLRQIKRDEIIEYYTDAVGD